jgi:hypothetical protein
MAVDAIGQTAFIRGQILHQGTGEPIDGEVHITAPIDSMVDEMLPAVVDKVLPDGTFVISGCIDRLFPKLNSQNYQLNLNIRVKSPQFRQDFLEYSRSVTVPMGSDFDPEPPVAPDPLIDVGVVRLPVNPFTDLNTKPVDPDENPLDLLKKNLQVGIRGRVVEARDPERSISSATVEILHLAIVTHTITTNAAGRYRFDNIVVIAPSRIQCSAPGFNSQTRPLRINFSQLIHEEYFRLTPS